MKIVLKLRIASSLRCRDLVPLAPQRFSSCNIIALTTAMKTHFPNVLTTWIIKKACWHFPDSKTTIYKFDNRLIRSLHLQQRFFHYVFILIYLTTDKPYCCWTEFVKAYVKATTVTELFSTINSNPKWDAAWFIRDIHKTRLVNLN